MPVHATIRSQSKHIAMVMALSMLLVAALANADVPTTDAAIRIHRYASFDELAVSGEKRTSSAVTTDRAAQRTQLRVYGKQLILNLENNTLLTNNLPNSRSTALRGTLEGNHDSWVRLTRTASGTHGLIWDGTDMYAVEPATEVRSALATSLPAPTSATVIFKLADTTVDLGANYCGASDHPAATTSTGLATYQAMATELTPTTNSVSAAPSLLLELQALGDAAFRAEYDSDQEALDAMLVRLNNVDGIFTAQMGLEIHAASMQLYANDPPGLSNSSSADALLSSLGQLRSNDPVMRTFAASHLFTGRDLDGDTLGIAYIGNLCGVRYASSLSEIRNRGAWIDSLVAAHELGHQLGAVHDGTGSCAGTAAQGYLMSAQINGSSELSQCSRDSIFATMQQSACLIPVGTPDVSVSTGASPVTQSTTTTAQSGGGGAFSLSWWLCLGLLAYRRRARAA